MRHRYAILEAPSALGHVPEHLGVERAPGVLLEAGLADGLDARRAGCLPAGGYSGEPDPRTKVMNPRPLHDYSRSLADQVEAILDNGEFPVVLGGDCSLLLGAMLALRRRGRYGVLYVDGDADFYQPEVNPLRGAASASDLAFATGRGPDIVCDLEGRRPLVRDGDVAVLGCRDEASRERRGCQPLPHDMLVLDRDHVRRVGAAGASREAVTFLTRPGEAVGRILDSPGRRCLRPDDHAVRRRPAPRRPYLGGRDSGPAHGHRLAPGGGVAGRDLQSRHRHRRIRRPRAGRRHPQGARGLVPIRISPRSSAPHAPGVPQRSRSPASARLAVQG